MCLAFSLLEALFYHNCQGEHTPILKAFYSFELSPNGEIRGCTIRAADWSCTITFLFTNGTSEGVGRGKALEKPRKATAKYS